MYKQYFVHIVLQWSFRYHHQNERWT